ncbi:two-component system sensor histidine kinase NtrB [Ferrigenium sp. UT5]|uniref:two-component system sensor histidine kinase NtrB n=1 Tax=Ferrigenium sp. UT5 TaxID=3242105 RepID=UPI00354DC5EA
MSLNPERLWHSLALFNLYRLVLGGVLMLMSDLFGAALSLTAREQASFFWVSAGYTVLVLLSVLAVVLRRPPSRWQLAFQVCTDIVCISLLTYFSGGVQSNLSMLLLVSLAFAGLISHGRITLLYAALASIALLLEHAYAVLKLDAPAAQFFQVGILCISYFALAWLAHGLSRYALASEKLATSRGADLASMAEANRLMIQDMPDGMLVVDERGRVRQSNPGASRLLGFAFTPGEGVGLGECSPLLEALYAAWRQNPELGSEILHLPRTNNPVRVRFLRIGGEALWGAVIVLEDVQRVQEQARQVKLAALGRLTANIAHEVRNPLSSISYAAELMQEEAREPAQARLLQLIRENTLRLDRIVQDVMQLSRRDRSRLEILDLGRLLPEFVEALCLTEQVEREGIALQLPQVCKVCFDRGHFEQVLWNLCRNALRYSRGQAGSVQVRASRAPGGSVVLEVEDDGPGVAADALPKLFEPFYTTDSRGTGLGLYIARELCEANGARIEYRHGEGGGACFRITLAAPAKEQGD